MYDVDDDGTQRVAMRGGSAPPFGGPNHPPDARGRRPPRRRHGVGVGQTARGRRRTRGAHARGLTIVLPRRTLTQAALSVVGFGLAVVAAVMAVSVGGPVETVRSVRYDASPPAEWSADARWRTPPLLPRSGPALVIGADRVAVLTADRHLMLIDAATGNTVWAAELPAGDPTTNVAATSVDGHAVVAVQLGDRLCWWTLRDGTPGLIELPSGARVTFLGEAPLIVVAPSTVATIRNGSLVRTPVPTGALALAARRSGVVTAAATTGWWHLRPGREPGPPTRWETIDRSSTSPTVISYSGGQIITVLPGKTLRVLIYSDRDKDVRLSFGGVISGTGDNSQRLELTWKPSPSGAWGILSRSLLDLTRGRIVDLGDWTTRHVASDRALGTIGEEFTLVGPAIPRGRLVGGEGFPEDLTAAGALVRARENGSETLYLLPPRIP